MCSYIPSGSHSSLGIIPCATRITMGISSTQVGAAISTDTRPNIVNNVINQKRACKRLPLSL